MKLKSKAIKQIIIAAILLISVFIIFGCSKSAKNQVNGNPISGKYFFKKNKNVYLELKDDGSFALYQGGRAISGTFKLKGNALSFAPDYAKPTSATIAGKTITFKKIKNSKQLILVKK